MKLPRLNHHPTLWITFPFGQTLALALLILALLVGIGEMALRAPSVRSRLPPPSVGSTHIGFEVKLDLLRKLVEKEGAVDCIFLGSSMINRGINPVVFQKAYHRQTGDDILCFNFGASGGGAYTQIVLANLLIADYHPRLLVFEASPLLLNSPAQSLIADVPWVQYRRGTFSIEGWLVEHSLAYRYSLLLGMAETQLTQRADHEENISPFNGQNQSNKILTLPLAPDQQNILARIYPKLHDYGRERLDQMLAFHQPPQTQVVLVEVPLSPRTLEGDPDIKGKYQRVMAQARQYASQKNENVLFWPTTLRKLVPDDSGWADVNHLNRDGAEVFSRWLGRRVGSAVKKGLLADPTHQ